MFKLLSRAAIALALAAGLFTFTPLPVYAGNQGGCLFNNWPANGTGKWLYTYSTTGTTYIDHVYGYATSRPLYPCNTPGFGWSFEAAANIEGDGIFQLGFLQESGSAGQQNWFVYTSASGSGAYTKITSPRPTMGTRYQFHIWRNAGRVSYSIATASGSILWSLNTTTNWTTLLKTAWWGFETGNSKSQAGLVPGSAATDIVGQYSTSASNSIVPMKNIVTACRIPVDTPSCHAYADMLVSGASNQIFNAYGYLTYP